MARGSRAITPHGAWPSPITAASLVSGAVGIGEVHADRDGVVWWSESRPEEAGRTAVMRRLADQPAEEVTPPDANVRTLVHEYGGGAWCVDGDVLYWVDFVDQRMRRTGADGATDFLTDEPPTRRGHRYADGRVTPDGRWIVAVRERHEPTGAVVNELVAIPTDGSAGVEPLWAEADFVMSPRVAPAGDRLAWISWDHPNMPWDATRLHVHEFADGRLGREVVTLGAGETISFCEPEWGRERLRVCSDHDGWWNLYDVDQASGTLLAAVTGPFDIATPPWVFGMQRWAAVAGPAGGEEDLIAVAGTPTGDELVVGGRTLSTIDSAISSVAGGRPGEIVCTAAGFGHETEVVRFSLDDGGRLHRTVVREARPLPFAPEFLVEPEWISFPTTDDAVAHGLFYPPTNPGHVGPSGERPPLLVLAHGGPTAQARRELQPAILFWTSRGIAVVDVDYRGSTGYGREYRRALEQQWGIADVADCVAAARHLGERGDVDPDRLIIRGGSAGGFTVLSALAFHDLFAVGASRYGVADLEALATDTHKFESRYLDSMVGPYPEARAVYEARSPINHVEGLAAPMIVLQGDEDEIVPPDQSEMIVAALERRGVPVAYLLFEGEQHGFRQAANIVRALEAELAFFGEMLGFEPADDLAPVEIRRP